MESSFVFQMLVTLAAVSDVTSRKIPNPVNFILLLSGVLAAAVGWIDIGALDATLGVATCLAVLLLPFALNVYKGGDVKLCMGMGAWLGVQGGLWAIAIGVVAGGVLGALILAIKGRRADVSVPMAVCFAGAGLWINSYGLPM